MVYVQKEIFFRKSGKISWMCEDYMQIEYKDKSLDSFVDKIYLEDDVLKIFVWWVAIWIDCSKKNKKRFRLFYAVEK